MKKLTFILLGCISALLISSQSFAETTMSQEGQYIFNSLGFYLGGVLVAFMAAGFCMLESGLVTTKSVSTIAAKNIVKFAKCSLVFLYIFSFALSWATFTALKSTIGLRISKAAEKLGTDKAEVGVTAYSIRAVSYTHLTLPTICSV